MDKHDWGEGGGAAVILGRAADQVGQGTEAIHLIRRNVDINMARFYRLELASDLFGGVVLARQWGRIGTEGQARRAWFANVDDAEAARAAWVRRKAKRGYRQSGS